MSAPLRRALAATGARRLRSFQRAECGAATVEFAIVASVLFLLLFGIVEFGIVAYRWNVVTEGARVGARLAMVRSNESALLGYTRATLRDAVRTAMADNQIDVDSLLWAPAGVAPTSTAANNIPGNLVRVVTSYPSLQITGLFRAMQPRGSAESVIMY